MQSTGVFWIPLYEILEERRAGEPVVAEIAHLWATEQLLPTCVRDSGASNLLAATGRTRAGSGDLHSAHAKSPDADERAIGQRDQRHKRADRTGDHSGDRGRRAQSTEASCAQ